MALATFVSRIYGPLTALTNARVDVMSALVSFERVFEVLDAPSPIADRPGAVDLVAPTGRIELDDVGFAYPTDVDRRRASSRRRTGARPRRRRSRAPSCSTACAATIEPGQLVALVGPSGAGKTTLAPLVPRLYDVTGGAVRIDGIDVRDLTQDSLRAAIGVVSQEPHLFHDTIGGNLRYARPDATDDELWAAARAAQIDELIGVAPRRARHAGRRPRPPPLGRREAAHRHRPHAAQGPGHRDPRRGHQPPRRRERVARPAGAGRRARRPHRAS